MKTALVLRYAGLTVAFAATLACAHDFPFPATDGGTTPPPGLGQDDAANAACLACHEPIAPRWQLPSSHGVLLDCTHCHGTTGATGRGHASSRPCGDCHSHETHPAAAACTACHDPHGTDNAFLVRESIKARGAGEVEVRFTTVEGASADGLVRAGVDGAAAGTGLCEVCHTETRYYRRTGDGAPHETGWCPRCHLHQNGFGLGLP